MVIERNIIKMNHSHILVLPKYWIEQHNLRKGNKLYLTIQQDGKLLLSKEGENETD